MLIGKSGKRRGEKWGNNRGQRVTAFSLFHLKHTMEAADVVQIPAFLIRLSLLLIADCYLLLLLLLQLDLFSLLFRLRLFGTGIWSACFVVAATFAAAAAAT